MPGEVSPEQVGEHLRPLPLTVELVDAFQQVRRGRPVDVPRGLVPVGGAVLRHKGQTSAWISTVLQSVDIHKTRVT
jgi:hypothetical protein